MDDMPNKVNVIINKLKGFGVTLDVNAIMKGVIEGGLRISSFLSSFPDDSKAKIMNTLLFGLSKNADKDLEYVSNTGNNTCVFVVHGLGGDTTEIRSFGVEISRTFGFDCIGIGYNELIDVNNLGNSLQALFKKIDEIVAAKRYNKYILLGYSLGVNIAAWIGYHLQEKNIPFDFIGYKGYSSVEACLKTIIGKYIEGGIKKLFGDEVADLIKIKPDDINELTIDLLLGSKAADFKQATNNVNIIGQLKTEKSNVVLLTKDNNITDGHGRSDGDIAIIKKSYDDASAGEGGDRVIILVSADNDNLVDKGMADAHADIIKKEFTPEAITIFNTSPSGPRTDEGEGNGCDCGGCCPTQNGQ